MTVKKDLLCLAIAFGLQGTVVYPALGQSLSYQIPAWTQVRSAPKITNPFPEGAARQLQEAVIINTTKDAGAAANNYRIETGVNVLGAAIERDIPTPETPAATEEIPSNRLNEETPAAAAAIYSGQPNYNYKVYSYETTGDECDVYRNMEPYYGCCQAIRGGTGLQKGRSTLASNILFGNLYDQEACCVQKNQARGQESNGATFISDFRQECQCGRNPFLVSCQSCLPEEWIQYQTKSAQENGSPVKAVTIGSEATTAQTYYALETKDGIQKTPMPPACPKICDNPPPIVDGKLPYDPYDQFWTVKAAWVHPAQLNERWTRNPDGTATTHLTVPLEVCSAIGGTTATEEKVEQGVATDYGTSNNDSYKDSWDSKSSMNRSVDCLVTKPVLSCEKPPEKTEEPPVVVTPEPPETPVVIQQDPPKVTPISIPLSVCVDGDLEAAYHDKNGTKMIPLSTPCRLSEDQYRAAVTNPKQIGFAIEVNEFMRDPKDETFTAKLAPKLAENLTQWVGGDTTHSVQVLRIGREDDEPVGMPGNIVDRETVVNNIKNYYKITQEGLIPTVNSIEMSTPFTPNSVQFGNAEGGGNAGGGPQPSPPGGNGVGNSGGGSPGPNGNGPPAGAGGSGVTEVGGGTGIQGSGEEIKKKNKKEEEVSLEALAITMEAGNLLEPSIPDQLVPTVVVAYAHGEGGGCALSTKPTRQAPLWTFVLPIFMMAAWRFRPQRRRP